MKPRIDVSLIFGVCGPERSRIAGELARRDAALLIAVSPAGPASEALEECLQYLALLEDGARVVLDCRGDAQPAEMLGLLLAEENLPGLDLAIAGPIAVVDAPHFMSDLLDDGYVEALDNLEARLGPLDPAAAEPAEGRRFLAHAVVAAEQVEFARHIIVTNTRALGPGELTPFLSLLAHLSPSARIGVAGAGAVPAGHSDRVDSPARDTPGWVRILNREFDPLPRSPRIGYLRYEQLRPLHPGRLLRLLNTRVERREFGVLLRSAGFCRFATRPGVLARWNHVGHMISFEPLEPEESEPLGVFGQEIAFIGEELDTAGLRRALDDCALSDAEFAAGVGLWTKLPDPLPRWFGAAQFGS